MTNSFADILNDQVLSTEAIKVQKDTTIVNTLNMHFQEISDIIKNNNVKPGKALSNRSIRVMFAKIDNEVNKRFGINVRTIENPNGLLSVQTTPPNAVSVLAGNVPKIHKDIRDSLEYANTQGTSTSRDDIDVRSTNWVQVMKTYLRSVDEVERAISTTGITVDLENAKMYGYPKDAMSIIMINPVLMFAEINMTPEEVTAAYLHEVGHVFTHLEYSYRSVRNTTTLIDSLIGEVGSNKPPLTAIKLAYSKAFNDEKINDSVTATSAVVGITGKYISELRDMGGSSYALKDSERLADQFASRFGIGADLGTGLAKLHEYASKYAITEVKDFGLMLLGIYMISLVVGLFIPALGIAGALFGTALLANFVLIAIIAFVFYAIYNVIAGLLDRGINKGNPYDNPKRRVLRLKNDLVRELRTSKLDKDATKAIITSIDLLVSVASKLDDKTENLIYRTIGKMFTYSDDQNHMRDLDDLVEDLMNNDLHVDANKFKTI